MHLYSFQCTVYVLLCTVFCTTVHLYSALLFFILLSIFLKINFLQKVSALSVHSIFIVCTALTVWHTGIYKAIVHIYAKNATATSILLQIHLPHIHFYGSNRSVFCPLYTTSPPHYITIYIIAIFHQYYFHFSVHFFCHKVVKLR